MLHHSLWSATGIPHSMQTRTRCFGSAFRENSFVKKDMIGMRRRNPLRGLQIAAGALVFGLAACFPHNLGAFGDEGHRTVGLLAEMHLKPPRLAGARALTETRRILRPQETLADAAVWPDTIKSATYEDGDTALFRLAHPAQDTYHYTNPPFQAERYDGHADGRAADRHPADDARVRARAARPLVGLHAA